MRLNSETYPISDKVSFGEASSSHVARAFPLPCQRFCLYLNLTTHLNFSTITPFTFHPSYLTR